MADYSARTSTSSPRGRLTVSSTFFIKWLWVLLRRDLYNVIVFKGEIKIESLYEICEIFARKVTPSSVLWLSARSIAFETLAFLSIKA